MSLGQLSLAGVVNPCSTGVWLANQLIGATVSLTRSGVSIGGGVAAWTSQQFPLTQQVSAGDMIDAVQTLGGETSPALHITVGPTPSQAEVNSGAFFQPIYECGKCVFLSGMVPGADVVVSSNNKTLGQGTVDANGLVEVVLKQVLTTGDHLFAVQTACKTIKTSVPIDGGSPGVWSVPFSPTVEPVFACDRAIVVTGIMPGSQVTVYRGTTVLGQMWVPISTATFLVSPVAASGPDITAVVDFPGCKHDPGPLTSAPVQVTSGKPNAPTIAAILCAGKSTIDLDDLHIGATVEVNVDGKTYQFGASATHQQLPIGKMSAMAVVIARQGICSPLIWSDPSIKSIVNTTAFAQPVCFDPPNPTVNETISPVLEWEYFDNGCNATSHFDVQVATDAGFTNIVAKVSNWDTASNQWHVTPTLKHNTKYFWRVRATGNPPGPWASPFVFTTMG
jgi:hypothetical protein